MYLVESFDPTSFQKLTDEVVDTLWFFFPVDAQEVDGYAGEHDDQTDAADHRLGVKTEAQQQRPEHQVTHRNQQVHLRDTSGERSPSAAARMFLQLKSGSIIR